MKKFYDSTSFKLSKLLTNRYSTSFSLGIRLLNKSYREPIYSIYGVVRLGDEIVDTFHEFNKQELLDKFIADVKEAVQQGISLNPLLNSFQLTVTQYRIDNELIDQFFKSMQMDINNSFHDADSYNHYILGSAEVVGLMCLKVFCEGNDEIYSRLKPYAMKLGAAFQKINFLRDIRADYLKLGRVYFPDTDIEAFDDYQKRILEKDIQEDFHKGLIGIGMLPAKARFGVYLTYSYYYALFKKIKNTPASDILQKRIRINNFYKYFILLFSYFSERLKLVKYPVNEL